MKVFLITIFTILFLGGGGILVYFLYKNSQIDAQKAQAELADQTAFQKLVYYIKHQNDFGNFLFFVDETIGKIALSEVGV